MAKQLLELNDKYYTDFVKGNQVNLKIRNILSEGDSLEVRAAGGTTFSLGFWESAIGSLKQTWSKEEIKTNVEITGLNNSDRKVVDSILK